MKKKLSMYSKQTMESLAKRTLVRKLLEMKIEGKQNQVISYE